MSHTASCQFQTYIYEIFVCLLHVPLGEQICFYLTLLLCFKAYKPNQQSTLYPGISHNSLLYYMSRMLF